MFSAGHFIWLGAIAISIAIALVLLKRLRASDKAIGKAVMIILIALKLLHMSLSMKESEFGGYVLQQNQLSFHLCSIMIYTVIFTNVIRNEKLVSRLKSFMVPCLFIGAAMALLIPTEGVDIIRPRVWQYMLIHGVLVFYGIYLACVEKVDLSLKAYFNNLKLLVGVTLIAFLMNSVLEEYETNFLFLREPPMDNLPLLNLDNGWYVYFLTLAAVACILVLLVQLPFMIIGAKRAKKALSGDSVER